MITSGRPPAAPGNMEAMGFRSVRQRLRRIAKSLALRIPPIKEAVEELENWNETYALRAFLTFNDVFEIVLFNTYLERFHRDIFERDMPLGLKHESGSIWLRRVR